MPKWSNSSQFLRTSTLLLLAVIAVVALAVLWGCSPWSVRKSSALEQYFYARDEFVVPAFNAHGKKRKNLLRRAISALQVVTTDFSENQSLLTRALAEHDVGLCFVELGETERARQAFLRCQDFKHHLSGQSLPASARTYLRTIVDDAREQRKKLDN